MKPGQSGIIISKLPPYDGEYELDFDIALSTREWRWIKEISGYLPLTLDAGIRGGDPTLIIAFAVIALNRAGRVDRDQVLDVAELFMDAPFDDSRIRWVAGEEEDTSPPAITSEHDASLPTSSLVNQSSSGEPLRNGSDRSDEIPVPTGATR